MRTIVGLAALLLAAANLEGQERVWRPALTTDSVPRTVAEAEAQGRAYRRSSAKTAFPSFADTSAQGGTPQRQCVEIGSANIVRAGDFYAGPFKLYTEYWHSTANWSKLWWQPAHIPEPDVPLKLTVRVALLDGAPEAFVYFSEVTAPPKAIIEQLKDAPFFPSAIPLPHPGRWLMVPSLGPDWGCVIFTLK